MIADDSTVEVAETFSVSLGNLAGTTALVAITDTATVTITDNDTATVTLSDATVAEEVASGMVTVTATLDVAVPESFEVTVSTTDGTATAADDYTTTTSTLTFAGTTAGEMQTFTVPILNDADAEGDETFSVSLSGLTGTTVMVDTSSTATVIIADDDIPNVRLADVTVGEEAGTVTVTATLDMAVSGGFTVDASTADGSTNGATAGVDYTAVTETLSFIGTAGETQTVEVTLSNDTDSEADETFSVSLSNLAGTTLDVGFSSTATVTIEDDDRPTLTLGDVTVTEGDDPMTVTLTATLDIAVSGGFTANVMTTPDTALNGSDYTTTTTMLTFIGDAGEMQEFTVPILNDEVVEVEETFRVTLTNTSVLADIIPATVTIIDDDEAATTPTDTATPTQLNEQTLTRAAQVMTAGTLSAVGARVDAVAGGRGGSGGSSTPLAYQLGGQSSLRGLLETHGKAMLEGQMEYERLLEGASFVLPLAAAGSNSSATPGTLAFWGGLDSRTLAGDADNLDWDGKVSVVHLGIDRQFSEKLLAGVALSSNQSSFDYEDTATSTATTGEYRYNSVNLHPYFGWYPSDALRLWGTLGFGSGEIELETDSDSDSDSETGSETDAVQATDSTQFSLSGGFSKQVLTSGPVVRRHEYAERKGRCFADCRLRWKSHSGRRRLKPRMLAVSVCGCCCPANRD